MTEPRVNSYNDVDKVTSASLLAKAQSNDSDAWHRLVSLYSPLVLHWCRQAGLREPNLADVSQEVFLAVAKYIGQFHKEGKKGSFRGWLRTITATKIVDFCRAHGLAEEPEGGTAAYNRLVQLCVADGQDGASVADVSEEDSLLFHRALELIQTDFNERTWQAFWQVTIDERTAGDVATELGMTKNAVHLAKARVLNRLRQEFASLIEV